MAKKEKKKAEKIVFDENLPQNILPVGERVEEDKNIYISQAAYKEIHKFTSNKTSVESGGMLIGNVIEEFGKTNIVIYGFVEAKYSEATPTTLKFTHETWEYVHGKIEEKYEDGKIVGWIHTHPDFGIFLSEYDKFIQENFFNEEYQIAYVVDPIQNIEGFYFWINGRIEKCKGFYIFDKNGEKIEIDEIVEKPQEKTAESEESKAQSGLPGYAIAIDVILLILVIALGVLSFSLMNRVKTLETQQDNLVSSANQSLGIMQQQINSLSDEIADMQESLGLTEPDEEEGEEGNE
jgi:proteasome lid subunit RPN8/RPN11